MSLHIPSLRFNSYQSVENLVEIIPPSMSRLLCYSEVNPRHYSIFLGVF